MTSPISSNINPVQLLNAANAFKAASAQKTQPQPEPVQEETVLLNDENKILNKYNLDEIKEYAKSAGEGELSNDDIKYGLVYGRSVIADYLA